MSLMLAEADEGDGGRDDASQRDASGGQSTGDGDARPFPIALREAEIGQAQHDAKHLNALMRTLGDVRV